MKDLRLGMVGLDTSHCVAFTELLNLPDHPYHVPGGRVVIAYPGGSDAFSLSRERVDKYAARLQKDHGVKVVDSITAVAEEADAILLESVDGRQHLEQFALLAPYAKPVFIDKPFATSVSDAREILRLARENGTPVFSCSALRYAAGIVELGQDRTILGCEAFGPMAILPDFPGLFWYGIHAAEILFAKMGCGCRAVYTVRGELADVVAGEWADGRTATLYGHRFPKQSQFGARVFTDSGVFHAIAQSKPPFYAQLLPEMLGFFHTGVSPVPLLETLEIAAFLEAATLSRDCGEKISLAKYGPLSV